MPQSLNPNKIINNSTLEDPSGCQGCGSNSFIFMQSLTKMLPNDRLAHPPGVASAPSALLGDHDGLAATYWQTSVENRLLLPKIFKLCK